MTAPTASVANLPFVSGNNIVYTWSATGAGSYVVNLFQLTPTATTIVQTLTTSLTTNAATPFTTPVAGAAYMVSMVAWSGAGGTGTQAAQVQSPTLFYALTLFGGPQGIQGNPGVQGLQGPQGVDGPQGPAGIQGILSMSNYTTANKLLTTQASGQGAVYANTALAFDSLTNSFTLVGTPNTTTINNYGVGTGGSVGNTSYQLNVAGNAYVGTNLTVGGVISATSGSTHQIGNLSILNGNEIKSSGNLYLESVGATAYIALLSDGKTQFFNSNGNWSFCNTIGSAVALTIASNGNISNSNATSNNIGGLVLNNGALTATSINNGAATLTLTSTTGTNINTLTVGAPFTATCNAIYTTGTINATSTNGHTLGAITFTNGAIAGVSSICNAVGTAITSIGTSGQAVGTIYAGAVSNVTSLNGITLSSTNVSGMGTLGCGAITSSGALGLSANGITSGTHVPATNNTYNLGTASTGLWANVYATTFVGALTGNCSGSSGSCTGNAATATNVAYSGLTGTVPTWNQNTTGSSGSCTGNAATATNVAYSGLTGTVPTWNQNTTGTAALASGLTGTPAITVGTVTSAAHTATSFVTQVYTGSPANNAAIAVLNTSIAGLYMVSACAASTTRSVAFMVTVVKNGTTWTKTGDANYMGSSSGGYWYPVSYNSLSTGSASTTLYVTNNEASSTALVISVTLLCPFS